MNWNRVEARIRNRVRRFGMLAGHDFYMRHRDDVIALGLVEAFDASLLGLEEDQCVRLGYNAAMGLFVTESRRAKRTVSIDALVAKAQEEEDPEPYAVMGSRNADQEVMVDANKVLRIIGSPEMAEVIAYGPREEGGIERLRVEMRVRKALRT